NGHSDIGDNNIGGVLLGQLQRLAPIARFRHDLELLMPLEQRADSTPHQHMIVRQQNSNLAHEFTACARASTGSVIARSVPRPICESMSKVPPRRATRSCMPSRPRPFSISGRKPLPSSCTITWIVPAPFLSVILTVPAPEWRAQLCSASCTRR